MERSIRRHWQKGGKSLGDTAEQRFSNFDRVIAENLLLQECENKRTIDGGNGTKNKRGDRHV